MEAQDKSFWTSMPGILTGIAAVITALTTLVVTLTGGDAPSTTAPAIAPARPADEAVARPAAVAPEPAPVAAPELEPQMPVAGSLFRAVDPPDHFVSVRATPTKDGREVARLRPGQTLRCTRKVSGQFRQYEGAASSDWYECPEAGGYVFSLLLRQAR